MNENQEMIAQNKDEKKAKKFWAVVKSYCANLWLGIRDSFRYNPCKLAGILVALPGLFIGFFLGFHSTITFLVAEGESNYAGLLMFLLVLFGCVNIFNGFTLISKRNLGTVITSSVCSLIITVCGIIWIERIFYSQHLVQSGQIVLEGNAAYVLGTNHIMSIISVALSILCSVAGCILGYIKRDKNYKKVKF